MVPASIPDGHLLVKEGSSVTGLDPANLGGPGGGATDHGALSGLEDDDHKQYALADGSRGSFAPPLGADDNYVTDAQLAALHSHTNKTALDQVSGVNTGDQDLSGLVPNTRTVNGKPLSANVTLNASDVGAATPQQVTDGDTATLSAAQSHAQALVNALTSASPETLDTLAEIATALGADPNFAATMTAALAARVRFDAAQSLSVPQQDQARTNIGAAPALGSDDNYVTDAEKLALHSHANKTALDAVSGTNTGDQDLSGYALSTQTINAQTGTTYTLQASDASKLVTCTNSGAITVTLPQDSDATFATGSRVDVAVLGAGLVTFAAGTGATVNGTPSLVMRAQYSAATCIKRAANTWLVVGDLATP